MEVFSPSVGSPVLTPATALRRLTELTPEVRAAVVLDGEGSLAAAEPRAGDLGDRLRDLTFELLEAADAAGGERPAEVEVTTLAGAVYVVRGQRTTVAVVAGRLALSSLMRFDLRRFLVELEREPA
jgi:hypothetical protein